MRGLKVNINQPARQHLAEGGMVHKIKGMLGLDPEKNARIQAYRDRAAAEKAAAASAPASSAAPAPAPKAITDYNSGGAMKRREAAAGLADGGIVRGPGTGTSDSVPDELPEGSYVLPADTTQAVGQQTTAMLNQGKASAAPKGLRGAKVPVQLSNGEMKLMPEQVHAIGIDTLEKMKAATHTPVAEQNQDQTRMFFANGGAVTEEERRRAQLAQIPVGGQTAPAADGRDTTEFSRNANNALNAMGGMGVVASVPMRAVTAARGLPGAYPTLAAPARAAAAPTADFIAGAGPNATVFANTIPRLGNAPTPVLPAVNAALQQGAQANAMAGAARAAAGASAGATGLANAQPADAPAAPPQAPAQGSPDGGQVRARWQDNLDELQNPTPYQGQVGNLFLQPSGTAAQVAAIRPGVYRGDAGRGAVNPPAVVPQNISPSQGATDPASASMAGAGAGTVNPPMANPSAPAPTNAQAPGGTTGNVTRVGNSYSGTNVTGDITVNGQAPRGGFMVADGPRGLSQGAPTTAAPQGVTAPTVLNSSNSWQARNDLRNLEVSASSITNNGGRFDQTKGNNAAQAAYKAGLTADAAAQTGQFGLDSEAMRQNGALQREGIQQEGANTRDARGLAVDRERLGIDSTRAQSEVAQRGVETAGAQQLQNLRNVLLDPKATPEQRKQAETSLQALSGRQQQANRFTVVPGGQEWDATAGAMRNVPARVLDNQSGQFVQDQGAGAQQPQQRTVGQVFTDANGKKAKWDGQKFVPL